jgi:metal-sulfur cluster biosynthetic enzyme
MERAVDPLESPLARRGLEDDRRRAVVEAVNGIADPCSIAMAEPIGIADLGLVEDVDISGGCGEISLLPTSPHCLFVGLFEEEIETRVSALGWVESVRVRLDEGETIWDEDRMTTGARERLARRRAASAQSLETSAVRRRGRE